MSFDLCQSFRRIAVNTFHVINDSRRMRFQLKEESFTDCNLFNLKLLHPDEIVIRAFNRIEEGRTGADWEWWLTDDLGRWIGYRVQAKVIALDTDDFTHLHYQAARSISQCDKLILQATTGSFRCIPLYCLYLTTTADMGISAGDMFLHGCSILSAYRVKELHATRATSLSTLWPDLKPWHRLVCLDNGGNIIDQLDRLTRSYFMPQREIGRRRLWTNEPPPYVRELRETGDVRASQDSKPIDLAGVMVIRQRG